MSSNVPFLEEGYVVWKRNILRLLHLLYDCKQFVVLCLLMQQLYEIAVWCCHESNDSRDLNVKDLKRKYDVEGWDSFCTNLCSLRNFVTHSYYNTYGYVNRIAELISSQHFNTLLNLIFEPTELAEFETLLCSYSLYLYTDDVEADYDLVKDHIR